MSKVFTDKDANKTYGNHAVTEASGRKDETGRNRYQQTLLIDHLAKLIALPPII